MVLPARKISTVEELLETFPDVRDLLIDGTERPIRKTKRRRETEKVECMILVEGVFRNKYDDKGFGLYNSPIK